MNLIDLLKSGENITITIKLEDLKAFADYVIAQSKIEMGQAIIDDNKESYPTVKQVQELFHVNPSTLWRWEKKGYLKTIEFGGGRRYRMSDIKAILNQQ